MTTSSTRPATTNVYVDMPAGEIADATAPAPTPRPMQDCGQCRVGGRDSECSEHGLDARPGAWRTPERLREGTAGERAAALRAERALYIESHY